MILATDVFEADVRDLGYEMFSEALGNTLDDVSDELFDNMLDE